MRSSSISKVVLLAAAVVFGGGASCQRASGDDAGVNLDRPVVGLDCGARASEGNALGIGRYCEVTSDCPVAAEGTTIQCSTVLTDDSLPLLCSRLCEVGDAGPACGEDAVCHKITELGYDLEVCVPYACDALFDGGLPRP